MIILTLVVLVVFCVSSSHSLTVNLDDSEQFWIGVEEQSTLPNWETLRNTSFRAHLANNLKRIDEENRSYVSNMSRSEFDRIVGGTGASIQNFRYQISIGIRGSGHFCGGSLIAVRWVLTAAHCFYGDNMPLSRYYVQAGSTYHASGGLWGFPSRIVISGKYTPSTSDYDIALIKLPYGYTYSLMQKWPIRTIRLAKFLPNGGQLATVSGWGVTTSGAQVLPARLRKATVPIIGWKYCNTKTKNKGLLTGRMFCAGKLSGGKDSCQGDSGGPIVHNKRLIGIVSWGLGCAVKNAPGVYTNVPRLRNYIRQAIKRY